MKKASSILLAVTLIFSIMPAMAEEGKQEDVPLGMEKTQVGGVEMLVPKGLKFYKKGDLITLETMNEYVARKISEMDERLTEIETKEEELNKKIERIDETLTAIQKQKSTTGSKDK